MEQKSTINVTRDVKNTLIPLIEDKKYFLLNNSETERIDLFNFALALGVQEGQRTPLKTSDGLIRTSYVDPRNLCLYYSIFYDRVISKGEEDTDKITDMTAVLRVIEEFANTGFIKLGQYIQDFDDEMLTNKLINEIKRLVQ